MDLSKNLFSFTVSWNLWAWTVFILISLSFFHHFIRLLFIGTISISVCGGDVLFLLLIFYVQCLRSILLRYFLWRTDWSLSLRGFARGLS